MASFKKPRSELRYYFPHFYLLLWRSLQVFQRHLHHLVELNVLVKRCQRQQWSWRRSITTRWSFPMQENITSSKPEQNSKFALKFATRRQKMQTCKCNLRKFGWGMESKLCERWESFLNVWVLKCLFKWIFLEVMGNKHTAGRLTIRFWVKASCSLCRALFQLFTVKWWDNCPSREYKSSLRNSNRTQWQIWYFRHRFGFFKINSLNFGAKKYAILKFLRDVIFEFTRLKLIEIHFWHENSDLLSKLSLLDKKWFYAPVCSMKKWNVVCIQISLFLDICKSPKWLSF